MFKYVEWLVDSCINSNHAAATLQWRNRIDLPYTFYISIIGDVRVNQHPALASLHTIFMREHNRIATGLGALKNSWSDQIIFDEARKIVGAILQHITYNEYLPEILGSVIMNSNGLNPLSAGYFNGYQSNTNPSIMNEFVTAAFRFGHSMIRDSLNYHGTSLLFKDVFINPVTLYDTNGGIDSITKGLVDSQSQKVDNLITQQVTRHLFERQPGFGADLAAINIQRGRDHGIPFYLLIKKACNVTGNVHNPSIWASLKAIYHIPDDIDLFPAGVSETPVAGGKIGPTFACIIAKQFEALKKGDRYYYENSGSQAFTLDHHIWVSVGLLKDELTRQVSRRLRTRRSLCTNAWTFSATISAKG
ncbi:hypothetical protein CHS0354_038592 [Potamilus streckersoni]|uniref:Peroxidase n=1 Tax=Potamilus streckersoni TaxID=2493646 RepID=A0AAE0TFV3_9BIVA|nr:hypothetical protein CHS0354_038592 [Potamilus streckersoni]